MCVRARCKHASAHVLCISAYPASSTTGAWSNAFSFRILMVFLILTVGRTVNGAESRSSCRVRFHHLHRWDRKRHQIHNTITRWHTLHSQLEIKLKLYTSLHIKTWLDMNWNLHPNLFKKCSLGFQMCQMCDFATTWKWINICFVCTETWLKRGWILECKNYQGCQILV